MARYNDFAPLHRQITDSLREIVQKELKGGDKLPTVIKERRLLAKHEVSVTYSRLTLRRDGKNGKN